MASHTSTYRCEQPEERSSTLEGLVSIARQLAKPSRRERRLIEAVRHREGELAAALERAQAAQASPSSGPPQELVMALREPKGRPRYVAVVVDGVPVSLVVNPRGESSPQRELSAWLWLEERVRRDAA